MGARVKSGLARGVSRSRAERIEEECSNRVGGGAGFKGAAASASGVTSGSPGLDAPTPTTPPADVLITTASARP